MLLFYDLNIIPNDRRIDKSDYIKELLCLSEIVNWPITLKNEKVIQKYSEIGRCCPYDSSILDLVNIYYVSFNSETLEKFVNIDVNHFVEITFMEFKNLELITPNVIIENPTIRTIVDRHFKIDNNLLNSNYYNYQLDKFILSIANKGLYDFTLIDYNYSLQNIKTKLFDYQKNNINWMLDIESNPASYHITDNKLIYIDNGIIYNYQKNNFIKDINTDIPCVGIRGGIVCDEPGIGKTLQFLTLSDLIPRKTLIVVPNNLKKHWISEIDKHFYKKINVSIYSFDEFESLPIDMGYERIIVDEIHEIYGNRKLKEKLYNTKIQYKWGISGTPFINEDSLFEIIKFLTEMPFSYSSMSKFKYYQDIYKTFFKRNTRESVKYELVLPPININNVVLEFSDEESQIYQAEMMSRDSCDIEILRKMCCDVNSLLKKDGDYVSIDNLHDSFLSYFENKYISEKEEELSLFRKTLNIYKLFKIDTSELNEDIIIKTNYENFKKTLIELSVENFKDNPSTKELYYNFNHYKKLLCEQVNKTIDRLRSFNYYKDVTERLQQHFVKESEECVICLCSLDNKKITLLHCGHFYCYPCFQIYGNDRCAICRNQIDKSKIITLTNKPQDKNNYGTKLKEIIKICQSIDEKIIIYTEFKENIQILVEVLNKEGIKFITFKNFDDIATFREGTPKVFIISSINNASGMDLSFVRNMILFEPLRGEYSYRRDIEKQLIGRINRINQTNPMNIYKLIINGTIEEKLVVT